MTRRARGGSAAHLGLTATLARAHLAVVLPRSVWHGLGRLLRLPLISGSDIILEVELKVVHRRAFPGAVHAIGVSITNRMAPFRPGFGCETLVLSLVCVTCLYYHYFLSISLYLYRY